MSQTQDCRHRSSFPGCSHTWLSVGTLWSSGIHPYLWQEKDEKWISQWQGSTGSLRAHEFTSSSHACACPPHTGHSLHFKALNLVCSRLSQYRVESFASRKPLSANPTEMVSQCQSSEQDYSYLLSIFKLIFIGVYNTFFFSSVGAHPWGWWQEGRFFTVWVSREALIPC